METTKPIKKTGLIRTKAIVPFFTVAAIVILYFMLFFDSNLKSAMEFIGYQVIGAEVNIDKLNTSFLKGNLRIQGIEITDSTKPSHNMIQIGDIRFGVLWDGLLRAKIVIEEMAVEQIEIGTLRKKPGKVKPPEPKKTGPSDMEKQAGQLKDKALSVTKEKYSQNVLGDIAALLGGTSADQQLGNIENSLSSKKRLKEFEKSFSEKSARWQERIKSLPQGKEIQSLGDRLGKVKVKDFKTPQELQQSLQEIDSILKEADAKYKTISSTANDLNSEIKSLDQELKEIDALVKKDIADLESRFKIPKIDAKSLVTALFQQYMSPYMDKINKYQAMAEKYVPPNIMKKVTCKVPGQTKCPEEATEPDIQIQPRPRAKGVSYEFGRQNSYPLFWIKKISVTSKAGASANAGDISGLVTDVTSNQLLVGRPTVAKFEGTFPSMGIADLLARVTIDNRKADSRIVFDFNVGSYSIEGRDVVNSPDAKISFKKATGSIKSKGELVGLTNLSFDLDNQIKNIDYDIAARNIMIDDILKEVFRGIPVVTLEATGKGEVPDVPFDISSNLGPELQKGFEKQLNKKIEEARQKLRAAIDEAIGKEKTKVEGEFAKAKGQVEGEVKKVQDQINAQKTQADSKVNQAKKDSENQAKKGLEKAAEDLKKKLGL